MEKSTDLLLQSAETKLFNIKMMFAKIFIPSHHGPLLYLQQIWQMWPDFSNSITLNSAINA